MKLENQFCSLDLSKKIRDLKIFLPSEFIWLQNEHNHYELCLRNDCDFVYIENEGIDYINAYSIAELCDMLPGIIFKDGDHQFFIRKFILDDTYEVGYRKLFIAAANISLADALAENVIYLTTNKLIEAK